MIGIGLAEALPVAARLRWPNDIVVGGAKVAGILTELETPVGGDRYVIVGVGINANTPRDRLPVTDRLPATSLLVETGRAGDRLALLHDVTESIDGRLPRRGRSPGSRPSSTGSARSTTWPATTSCCSSAARRVTGTRDWHRRRRPARSWRSPDGGERRLDAGEVVRVGDDAARDRRLPDRHRAPASVRPAFAGLYAADAIARGPHAGLPEAGADRPRRTTRAPSRPRRPARCARPVYRFLAALPPGVAARLERAAPASIDHLLEAVDELRATTDGVIVEGGGLLEPLGESTTYADLAVAVGLPLVIVTRPEIAHAVDRRR